MRETGMVYEIQLFITQRIVTFYTNSEITPRYTARPHNICMFF